MPTERVYSAGVLGDELYLLTQGEVRLSPNLTLTLTLPLT